MYWPALKPSPAKNKPMPPATADSVLLPDPPEETDDGWIVLPPVPAKSKGKPPRPPPPPRAAAPAPSSSSPTATTDSVLGAFDPTPGDIVARYLPLRRSLRCDALPRQIHDADLYGAHPAFLAAVYPAANARPEWFFFVCRPQCPGGRRRSGPGAYRLGAEARLPGLGVGGAAYCHAFRYYEDVAGSASTKETEWRMDEYGDCRSAAAAAAFDMVVCKLYPARGGTVQRNLSRRGAEDADVINTRPQVLVRLYLDSLNLGDSRRCRMYAAADVFAAHPAVLTAAFPAANDRCEWFFAVHRRKRGDADEDDARPRRAGPGTYVPVRGGRAVNGKGGDVGYRRVYLYREDDETVRRVSRTEWWMEEYGFGRDFPFCVLPVAGARAGKDEHVVLYKLYMKMASDHL